MQGHLDIYDKVLQVLNKPFLPPGTVVIYDEDLEYIIDNALNDALRLTWESLIIMQDELIKTSEDTQDNMLAINLITSCLVIIFVLTSLKYMVHINSESSKFMNVLFKVTTQEAETQKKSIEVLTSILK